MRIEKLDIKGFGKFQNRTFMPDVGMNVIYGSNEAGKTTLQAFIRAMLFGLRNRRSKDGVLPAIKRYKPWQQGYYGGILEYSLDDGQRFCVARNFENNTITLLDAYDNSIIADFPAGRDEGPRFAEQHLGLTESCFERTAFIGQMRSALNAEDRKIVSERLINLRQSGDEEISVRRAIKALKEAQLSHVGSERTTTRPLNLLEARLADAMRREQELTELHESRLDLFIGLERLKEETCTLQAQLEETLQMKKAREAYDAYETRSRLYFRLNRYRQELIQTYQEAEKHRAAVDELTAEIHALKAYRNVSRQDCDEMSAHQTRWQILEKELEELRLNKAEVEQNLASTEKKLEQYAFFDKEREAVEQALQGLLSQEILHESKPVGENRWFAKRRGLIAGISLIIILMLADILWLKPFLPEGVYIGSLLLGAILLAGSAVLLAVRPKQNGPALTGRREQAENRDALLRWMEAASVDNLKDFTRLKSTYDNEYRLARELKQELDILTQKEALIATRLQDTKEKILSMLNKERFQENPTPITPDEIGIWKENVEAYNTLTSALKEAQAAFDTCAGKAEGILREASLICGESIHDEASLTAMTEKIKPVQEQDHTGENPMDLQTLQERISTLNEALVQNQLKMNTITARLENIPDTDALQQAHEQVESLLTEKDETVFLGQAIDTAIEAITEASMLLSKQYAPALNREMGHILSAITKERYPDIKADSTLALKLHPHEIAETVLPEQLSSGACDQIYFALRLAAVKTLEQNGEKLPLFLDEPFSQYDEERTKNALELLAMELRQIFLFTCKKREVELAQELFAHRPLRVINLDHNAPVTSASTGRE